MTNANPNVLSERYATKPINDIFSEEGKTLAERELWIAVMKAQRDLGVDIPEEQIGKYEAAKGNIDLGLIKSIEMKTKHDVKAKIEAFVQAAGADEHVHKGMTSRDLTDNVEQMQIKKASEIVFGKYVAVLKKMVSKACEYSDIILTARTHHQAAQPTTLGRRFAMWAEELMLHMIDFKDFMEGYPLRGIKGPVGTQFDMLTLLGDRNKVWSLEDGIAHYLGFNRTLKTTGQVYPRSLDYSLVSKLSAMASACENFAKGVRLMAGYELFTEGFKKGQVGSSAMPHKMNTRSSERICGFAELLKMYADGASRLSGDQWEEGDVSCSVLRRVIIPDAFYVSDGLCETTLTVLNKMGPYQKMIANEVERYLPFLATTEILMTAVKAGIGREQAHEIIKKYAVGEALRMREEGSSENHFVAKLSQDPVFISHGIMGDQIDAILNDKKHFIGNAKAQVADLADLANKVIFSNYEKESHYNPGEIL